MPIIICVNIDIIRKNKNKNYLKYDFLIVLNIFHNMVFYIKNN